VVEGINALPAAMRLARQYGVELPIMETVNAVVSGKIAVQDTVQLLMARGQKQELPASAFDNHYN